MSPRESHPHSYGAKANFWGQIFNNKNILSDSRPRQIVHFALIFDYLPQILV